MNLGETTVLVERMGQDGDGVARLSDGRLAFVSGALPGEVVDIRVTEERARFVRAVPVRWRSTSTERVQPPCPVYPACGGCVFQHWDYAAELRYKEGRVKEAVARIAQGDAGLVEPIRPNASPYGYRNKGQFPFGRDGAKTTVGLYRRGSHTVVGTDRCAIQDALVNQVLGVAERLVNEVGLLPYDERTQEGVLRHLLIRTSEFQRRALVLLVAFRRDRRLLPLARALMDAVPAIHGVGVNVNSQRGNRVLGPETDLLAGEPYLLETILGLRFRLSFTSFFQVNPRQAAVLYELALGYLEPPVETVWDLYSGVGTLACLAAARAKRVKAIEILPEAVKDAQENVKLNGLTNVEVEVGAVERVIAAWIAQRSRAPDAVIVDPPRKGLDESVVEALRALQPRRIVYISCRPETWARDVSRLAPFYRLATVTPVDMFPRSDHVELASLLERER
ncbi:MAG: 23S rRNA (uracil(1939)-C(5))-methyltransferase RlmD [Firmicutes bacterium]|nr:23S rRNA (uracil(1939)-C(5))-methyltransferase RlmD [Bacillota bacterium]